MKINKLSKCLLILLCLTTITCSFVSCSSKTIEPDSSYYVFDQKKKVSDSTKLYVSEIENDLYQKTGAQIVYAFFNSIDGQNIKDFSDTLFNNWRIGKEGKDNGILILVDISSNNYYIEYGSKFDTKNNVSTLKKIAQNYIEYSFQLMDFDGLILNSLPEIIKVYEQIYGIEIKQNSQSADLIINESITRATKKNSSIGIFIVLLILIVIFAITVIAIRYINISKKSKRRKIKQKAQNRPFDPQNM